jgi:hypothetical protein
MPPYRLSIAPGDWAPLSTNVGVPRRGRPSAPNCIFDAISAAVMVVREPRWIAL